MNMEMAGVMSWGNKRRRSLEKGIPGDEKAL